MNRISKALVVLTALLALLQAEALPQTHERSEVPIKDTWKLEDLYASDEAWNKAKEKLAAQFDEVLNYKGKLAGSPAEMLACLDFNSRLSKEFGRLRSYAAMKADEDTRNSKYLAMRQETPRAFRATTACSRELPHPKLSPATMISPCVKPAANSG